MTATTLVCPFDRRFRLVLDPSEVYPDDPGNGTPEMVYGPRDSSGTLNCVICEGELSCGPVLVEVPDAVYNWLQSEAVEGAIGLFWEAN